MQTAILEPTTIPEPTPVLSIVLHVDRSPKDPVVHYEMVVYNLLPAEDIKVRVASGVRAAWVRELRG